MKRHLKTIATPRTWPIKRKGIKFTTRPKPGKHTLEKGMPLTTIITKVLKFAKTSREVKNIINTKEVLVDGRRVKEPRYIIGLMDNLSFPLINEHLRIIINKKGKLSLIKIENSEAKQKLCKITSKKLYKNKIQLGLHDGRTILTDKKEYKVGDSIVIKVPEQEVLNHIPFEKGNFAYLISGKHIGEFGKISEINGNKIFVKTDDTEFETHKKCIFMAGKEKEIVKLR